MSPIKKKKLDKLRKELDQLDNSLIKIIKKRTDLVKKVLRLKDFKNQIVDKKRIKTILKNTPKIKIKIIKKMITIKTKYYLKAEKKRNKINSLMFLNYFLYLPS